MSKVYVVTGGAGFIGSHLVDALLENKTNRVVAVDNMFLGKDSNLLEATTRYPDRFKLYREDASDYAAINAVIQEEKPDVVYNLATKALLYSFFNPAGAFNVNTKIAENLAELLRNGDYGKLVHVSTSEVYGSAETVPMPETHPLLAETTYAAGKAAADMLLATYHNMFNIPVTTVRPFNNYGPRQNAGALAAVVPLTIKRILAGESPVLQGDGSQTRDFIYVKDTVKTLIDIEREEGAIGSVFNMGSGRETSIKEIVESISNVMQYSGEIIYEPRRNADVDRHCSDISKITTLMGSVHGTSLDEGMAATVQWYKENRDQL